MSLLVSSSRLSVLFAIVCFIGIDANSQTAPIPYSNYFFDETSGDDWSHYAISGTDDWQLGVPTGNDFDDRADGVSWVTTLNSTPASNSIRVLQTPAFDLSDTTYERYVSFQHYRQINASANPVLKFEYSLDNGASWQMLMDPDHIAQWQTSTGFTGTSLSISSSSMCSLRSIQDPANTYVLFRFYLSTGDITANQDGWLINNFILDNNYINITQNTEALEINQSGDTYEASAKCANFSIGVRYYFYRLWANGSFNGVNRIYLSEDDILEEGDSLLYSSPSATLAQGSSTFSYTIPSLLELPPATYHLFFVLDALNQIEEDFEDDNVIHKTLILEPSFSEVIATFDEPSDLWQVYNSQDDIPDLWEFGQGYRHHLIGSHYGAGAAHTSRIIKFYEDQYTTYEAESVLIGPYFHYPDTGTVMNFWYKSTYDNGVTGVSSGHKINCGSVVNTASIPGWNGWKNRSIAFLSGSNDKKPTFTFFPSYISAEAISIDDVYIGPKKPDLSIEDNINYRFTDQADSQLNLPVLFSNWGDKIALESTTEFYWSEDSIYDDTDVFLTSVQMPSLTARNDSLMTITLSKQDLGVEHFYIVALLDVDSVVDEMREYNNTFIFSYEQIAAIPYVYENDFEDHMNGWSHFANLGIDDWSLAHHPQTVMPQELVGNGYLTQADASGFLAHYNANSFLNSPIFDFTEATMPVLEFDLYLQASESLLSTSYLQLQYSIDEGGTWAVLDTSTNSYDQWLERVEFNAARGYDEYGDLGYSDYTENDKRCFPYQIGYSGRDIINAFHYTLNVQNFVGQKVRLRFMFSQPEAIEEFQSLEMNVFEPWNELTFILDNFSLSEGFRELTPRTSQVIYRDPGNTSLVYEYDLYNYGNAVAENLVVASYFSTDSLYSVDDILWGLDTIVRIRPNHKGYINNVRPLPVDHSQYGYLIFLADQTNVIEELNEENNNQYYVLEETPIQSYPYSENFDQRYSTGWTYYTTAPNGSHNRRTFRVSNKGLFWNVTDGYLATDAQAPTVGYTVLVPRSFAVTPSFNFTNRDSIVMSMNMGISGYNDEGANLEYSVNGGNTWALLDAAQGNPTWYNGTGSEYFSNEKIWWSSSFTQTKTLDISHLGGLPNVKFRFKYKASQSAAQGWIGFRMNNFLIQAFGQSTCPGDVNNDFNISIADLTILMEAFGDFTTNTTLDLNGNGLIDSNDITIWMGYYQGACE